MEMGTTLFELCEHEDKNISTVSKVLKYLLDSGVTKIEYSPVPTIGFAVVKPITLSYVILPYNWFQLAEAEPVLARSNIVMVAGQAFSFYIKHKMDQNISTEMLMDDSASVEARYLNIVKLKSPTTEFNDRQIRIMEEYPL